MITDVDCLYCGVQLLGATDHELENLCCKECEADLNISATELMNSKDMSPDECRYLSLSGKPFASLTDDDYKFMSEFELANLQGV